MTESIGGKLVQVLSGIIDIGLDQDGQQALPYAVYSLDVAPYYVKGSIYKYSGTMYIYIYANRASDARELQEQVVAAIALQMQDAQYRSRLLSASSGDDNGKYVQTLEFSITQVKHE